MRSNHVGIEGGGGGLDHNSQLFIYPISRSQLVGLCPGVRSQSQVINHILYCDSIGKMYGGGGGLS